MLAHLSVRAKVLMGVLWCRSDWRTGLDSWARAATAAPRVEWKGQRVPNPVPLSRPAAAQHLESWLSPVAVHAPAHVTRSRLEATLDALEFVHTLAAATGWVDWYGDAGGGGTEGHDLYLVDEATVGAAAHLDATERASLLDAGVAHARLDARIPDHLILPCVASAYVQMLLLERDPAENSGLRRATARYLAWLVSGEFGCDDAALLRQASPWTAAPLQDDDGGGAVWLAFLGQRMDGNSGAFLREAWQVARQWTWQGENPRGSPDLWESIDVTAELEGKEMDDLALTLGVDRYLHDSPIMRELGLPPAPPRATLRYADLPEHMSALDPPLKPLGSSAVRVQLPATPDGNRLRVWSRAEFGVRWSLSAVLLDSLGRELGRVTAPSRSHPDSFLSVEAQPGCRTILVVLTNLSGRLPDADIPDPNTRSARLTLDRGQAPGAHVGPAPAAAENPTAPPAP